MANIHTYILLNVLRWMAYRLLCLKYGVLCSKMPSPPPHHYTHTHTHTRARLLSVCGKTPAENQYVPRTHRHTRTHRHRHTHRTDTHTHVHTHRHRTDTHTHTDTDTDTEQTHRHTHWWWLFSRVRGFWENVRQFIPRLRFFIFKWRLTRAH